MEQSAVRTGPTRTIWSAPITPRENILRAFERHECFYLPNARDITTINPLVIPDNRARGGVMDGGERFKPDPQGEADAFGIPWIFEPNARGSMIKSGFILLDTIEDWRNIVHFPNPESWDWDEQKLRSEQQANDDRFARKTMIYTGFFERLISFMGFENAAVTMIDEDSRPYVSDLFDALASLYIHYIDLCKTALNIDIVELHDDWGSQIAPLLSYQTIEDLIIPRIARIADHLHARNMYLEMHSCGKIESLVPLMIQAKADAWMGQDINDKKAVFDLYGDKIIVEIETPELGNNATDEQIRDAAAALANDFIIPGKPVIISHYSASKENRPLLNDELYILSRTMYDPER